MNILFLIRLSKLCWSKSFKKWLWQNFLTILKLIFTRNHTLAFSIKGSIKYLTIAKLNKVEMFFYFGLAWKSWLSETSKNKVILKKHLMSFVTLTKSLKHFIKVSVWNLTIGDKLLDRNFFEPRMKILLVQKLLKANIFCKPPYSNSSISITT